MSAADDQLQAANWDRMRTAITDAANEYRRLADQLERVPFENSRGQRAPEAIISEVALTAYTNTAATLIHRLASWAESINEIERHRARAASRRCGYRTTDPVAVCVLDPDHGPIDTGISSHMTGAGVSFR